MKFYKLFDGQGMIDLDSVQYIGQPHSTLDASSDNFVELVSSFDLVLTTKTIIVEKTKCVPSKQIDAAKTDLVEHHLLKLQKEIDECHSEIVRLCLEREQFRNANESPTV